MRLATVWDSTLHAARAVCQWPGGGRVELRALHPSFTDVIAAIQQPDLLHTTLAQRPIPAPSPLNALPLLPPVPMPRTFRDFYAFEKHVATCRAKRGLPMPEAWYEQPVFYFSNPCSLVGQDAPVSAPAGCTELDYELELGLIIGRGGRDIRAADAWHHIAGFTIINDLSARDLQRREMTVGLGPAKGKDFATAVGPCLVTLDEFADRIDSAGRIHLEMSARVNGRELSRGNSADMYFPWPAILSHASRDAELMPGDLLGSGTVGSGCILELGPEATGGWLKPGDEVELEIERLGVLRTRIVARGRRAEDLGLRKSAEPAGSVLSPPPSVLSAEASPWQST